MLTIAEALAQILPAFEPLGEERLPISEALGRFATEPVPARRPSPAFDNSAMDGYAVRASDVSRGGTRCQVMGESRAGGPLPTAIQPGTAVRIFTGAALPEGADSVIMQENTADAEGGWVTFTQPAKSGEHVRRRGEDLQEGERLLEAGALLNPGEIALLASQGMATVAVHRRPVVAILSTGDELAEVSDPVEPGQIINSNAYALEAQTRLAGGVPWVLPTAPDHLETIEMRLQQALRADVVVSCGGVSVGTYDLVHTAFERAGVTASFWKVAIKPGKPVLFGQAGRTPVVGLPGNPVSSMVTFELFVAPGLRRMMGDRAPYPPPLSIRLADAHRRKPGRLEFARATLSFRDGVWSARLHPKQGSGSLTSVVGVDALVILPSDQERFEKGESLLALPFPSRRGSAVTAWTDNPYS